jgi:hypothetical protein
MWEKHILSGNQLKWIYEEEIEKSITMEHLDRGCLLGDIGEARWANTVSKVAVAIYVELQSSIIVNIDIIDIYIHVHK